MKPMVRNALGILALFILSALVFYLAIDFRRTLLTTQFFVFQARDLYRVKELLAGQPIFFGPEITGGGNLPGPFYYYLLAPALWINGAWMGAWNWMLALSALACLFGVFYLRAVRSNLAGLLFLAFFATAWNTRLFLKLFLNVSYLTFFAMLALIMICESYRAPSSQRRRNAFFAACFLLGLGIQLHMSIFAWLLALVWIQLFYRKEEANSLSFPSFLVGLGFFVIPLLPYLFWVWGGKSWGQAPPFIGSTQEVLPTYLRFLRLITEAPLLETLVQFHKIFEPVPLVLLIILAFGFFGREKKILNSSLSGIQLPCFICAAFSLVPFSYYFFVPIGFRYGLPLYLPLLFIGAERLESFLKNSSMIKTYIVICSIASLFALVLFFFYSPEKIRFEALPISVFLALLFSALAWFLVETDRRFSIGLAVFLTMSVFFLQRAIVDTGFLRSSYVAGRIMPTYRIWKSIWTDIIRKTGWSYEQAIERTYFLQHHMEQDGRPSFERIEALRVAPPAGERVPDGFIVSLRQPKKEQIPAYVRSHPLPKSLRNALDDGTVELGSESLNRDHLVLPYWTHGGDKFPAHFHNSGEGYFRSSEERQLDKYSDFPGVERLADSTILYRWNDCPERPSYCSTAIRVKLKKEEGEIWSLQARLVGSPISQISPWISPDWTESWQHPFVEVACGNRKQRFELIDTIGYNREHGAQRENYTFNYNQSFVAPFERSFHFRCRTKITEVAAGHEGMLIESVKSVTKGPGRRLVFRLEPVF